MKCNTYQKMNGQAVHLRWFRKEKLRWP